MAFCIKKADETSYNENFFFKLEDISPFCGATKTPVLDFWWCLPWLLKPGWIFLLVCFIACMHWFLRFTSSVASADLSAANVAAEPFWSTYLHTSIGKACVQEWACRCFTACDKIYVLMNDLWELKIKKKHYWLFWYYMYSFKKFWNCVTFSVWHLTKWQIFYY